MRHYPGDGCPSTPPTANGHALELWEKAHRPEPVETTLHVEVDGDDGQETTSEDES